MTTMTGRFHFTPTGLAGVQVVERRRMEDQRGFLSRLWCAEAFADSGLSFRPVQINHTLTRAQGAVRGMHFQHPPHDEYKLVSCLKGQVFDVAVDLRAGSPSFLQWHGERLSAENGRALLIPPGCAHGFQSLSKDCELVYLHSAAWHAEAEGAVNCNDPRLGIMWPLPIAELSERDRRHPLLESTYQGIAV